MLSDELRPATFRGIPFLMSRSTTTGGAKTVTFEYPNDDRRYVEPLGKLQKTFNVTGIISDRHGDYLAHRDTLIEALEDGSIGILSHPWYGRLKVSPKPYTIEEEDVRLGECVINMVFEISNPPVNPHTTNDQLAQIGVLSNVLDGQLQSQIESTFNYTKSFTRNFTAAKLKITGLIGQFDYFNNFLGSPVNTSGLKAKQSYFNNNIASSITAPSNLATNISDLFDAANTTSTDPNATALGMQSLFDFGDDDVMINNVTHETSERNTNNAILNYSTQAYALLYAYNNYAQADFTTELDLESAQQILEAQYDKLYSNLVPGANGMSIADLLGDEVFDTLQQIRNLVRLQFENLAINISKIVDIKTNVIPVTVLSYQYYGDTDHDDQIIALNNLVDVSFASGTLKAVTQPDDTK